MSNTQKTFKFAGWSLLKGKWKLRYANDQKREKHLVRFGHQHVVLIQLPEPMTERDGARYLFADTNLMATAPWRNYDTLGENHPSLDSAQERNWYFQHWLETHPEEQY
jgi:hypothetical protein